VPRGGALVKETKYGKVILGFVWSMFLKYKKC
jgi:hypothetical protein